jgi:thiol:disulfide interchange protein DsbD
MFATCVWLLWVLMQQVDAGEVALALGAVVAVGFALWALGLSQRGVSAFRWVALSGAVVAALTFTPIVSSGTTAAGKVALGDGWIEYSRERLVQLQGEGRPVFVDFTAAWCVTCQVNKRTVLDTERVRARFAAEQIVLMRADWTSRDERITQALAEFGRNGVPLYVLYDRSGKAALLPQLLTPGIVFEALDKIK